MDSLVLPSAPGWCWATTVHFMVPGISSSIFVGVMSCGGIEIFSPTIILNLMWIVRTCLRRIGGQSCQTIGE